MNKHPSDWQLHNAARIIKAGGVIAYPTEAVFGLGCDPGNADAVFRLLDLKHRSQDKGLILIASEWQQLAGWLQTVPAELQRRLEKSWPGPVTWLIPAADRCPRWLTGKHQTLAVRVTAHPLVRRLCARTSSALVSTSANRAGKMPARSVLQVKLQFGNELDLVLPGQTGGLSRPTEIRDLESGRLIRDSTG